MCACILILKTANLLYLEKTIKVRQPLKPADHPLHRDWPRVSPLTITNCSLHFKAQIHKQVNLTVESILCCLIGLPNEDAVVWAYMLVGYAQECSSEGGIRVSYRIQKKNVGIEILNWMKLPLLILFGLAQGKASNYAC